MSKLIKKTFDGKVFFKGFLKPFAISSVSIYFRIIKENGKYQVYLSQKRKIK